MTTRTESIKNRKEAIEIGLNTYKGATCAKHVDIQGERYVTGSKCIGCIKDVNAARENSFKETPELYAYYKAIRRINMAAHRSGIKLDAAKLLGCDANTLFNHLKTHENVDLTGTNYHIDHIKPVGSFNLKLKKDRIAAFHYTNLQALVPIEHVVKTIKEKGHNIKNEELRLVASVAGVSL